MWELPLVVSYTVIEAAHSPLFLFSLHQLVKALEAAALGVTAKYLPEFWSLPLTFSTENDLTFLGFFLFDCFKVLFNF